MATPGNAIDSTYDALMSTTLRNYRPKMSDNIFKKTPLLYWLNEKGRKRKDDGGTYIII